MSDTTSDNLFRSGQYEQAAERLKKGLDDVGTEGRDGLLYLLDLGLSLHAAGKYEESNRYFLQADQLAEIKDYTSLAAETATLFTSDNLKQYKGEDFENVLINVYLSMNFALLGQTESALVEARRVNRKLNLMVTDGQRKYKQNAFARYLSAILYEQNGDWNDAYLDYKFTADLWPDFEPIGIDQWRMAYKLRMTDVMERLEKKYALTDAQKKAARELVGTPRPSEIIVIYENGISPVKRPDPGFHSVPKFYPRTNPVSQAEVTVAGLEGGGVQTKKSTILHDIEATAIQNLEEKWGGIVAKKVGGIVAKEVAGNAIGRATKNDGLGALVKLVMYASDQADLRSWNLLPRDLQMVRFTVKPGNYTVRTHPVGASPLPEKVVSVGAGKKVFVNFRYTP